MKIILVLAGCQLVSIIAQLCLKIGVRRAGRALHSPLTAWRAAFQPLLWVGAGLYAGGTILWVKILMLVDLSFAYPFAALAYVGGVLSSQWLLREKVSATRWLGVGLILAGLIFVAASG